MPPNGPAVIFTLGDRNLAPGRRGRRFGQADVAVPVDHRLEGLDLGVGHLRRTIAHTNQGEDAEAGVYRSTLLDDPHEKI